MKWQLISSSLTAIVIGLAAAHDPNAKNIAIIGAGAAGSSAAYHLRQYAEQEGIALNVTIFEKSSHIGGRTLTVNAFDSPDEPIELGASIFVTINRILYGATQDFDLPLGEGLGHGPSPDDVTVIWDGENIVYQTTDKSPWWWDATKLVWKYGTAPYRAVNLVKEVVGQFLKLYEEPYFPFRSLTQRVFELELAKVTAVTGEQFLQEKGINPDFSREIIQAATRVNYASNLAYIHGLEAMVSFATDGAVSVAGGNWRIFDQMVRRSGAALNLETNVNAITLANKNREPGSPAKYLLTVGDLQADDSVLEEFPVTFDNVIIASPWQYSDIEAGEDVIRHKIDKIPYTKLHVTIFTSPYQLHPGFFGLQPGTKAPDSVYTTLGKDEKPQQGTDGVGRTGFYSISKLRSTINPATGRTEFIYKIFSPKEVTSEFLTDILGAHVPHTFTTDQHDASALVSPISWYYPHWFYAYPVELPRVTFQDPIIGDGLYYTSGIESFISTMETSALMGKNVARLIADDFAGIQREDVDDQGGLLAEEGERFRSQVGEEL